MGAWATLKARGRGDGRYLAIAVSAGAFLVSGLWMLFRPGAAVNSWIPFILGFPIGWALSGESPFRSRKRLPETSDDSTGLRIRAGHPKPLAEIRKHKIIRYYSEDQSAEDLSFLLSHPSLERLTLDLWGAPVSAAQLEVVGRLRSLKELEINGFGQLPDIGPIHNLENLAFLELSRCDSLQDASGLASLTRLRTLRISSSARDPGEEGIPELADLDFLPALPDLQWLQLRDLALADTRGLASLPGLKRLDLRGCLWRGPLGLRQLPELEEMVLGECGPLDELAATPRLRKLKLHRNKLDLALLAAAPGGLQELQLETHDSAPLASLANLPGLTTLGLTLLGETPSTLEGLGGANGLKKLRICGSGRSDGPSFDLGALASVRQSLEELELVHAWLGDLRGIEDLPHLRVLTLLHINQLPDLAGLRELPNLTRFRVHSGNTDHPRSLAGLEAVPGLAEVELYFCQESLDLDALARVPGLKAVNVYPDGGRGLVGADAVRAACPLAKVTAEDRLWSEELEGLTSRLLQVLT
jgi:hypothetical protein